MQQLRFDFAPQEVPKSRDLRKYEEARAELRRSFARYKEIIEHGTSDPFWPDGVNANLVRNHIIFYKGKLKEMNYRFGLPLPEEYSIPTPDVVDPNYMAPGSKACWALKERDKGG